jgi:hypothetical protein
MLPPSGAPLREYVGIAPFDAVVDVALAVDDVLAVVLEDEAALARSPP